MSEQGKSMSDEDVMAETSVFRHKGWVYYKHESGEVFAVDATNLGRLNPETRRGQSLPEKAKPYDPAPSMEAKVDDWTDYCDALVRAETSGSRSGL